MRTAQGNSEIAKTLKLAHFSSLEALFDANNSGAFFQVGQILQYRMHIPSRAPKRLKGESSNKYRLRVNDCRKEKWVPCLVKQILDNRGDFIEMIVEPILVNGQIGSQRRGYWRKGNEFYSNVR